MGTKSNTKGISLYSDKKIPKQIVIQEDAHNDDRIINLFKRGSYSCENELKHSLMHEIGHQFDSYYGHNHQEYFALKRDSLLEARFADKNQNPLTMPNNRDDIETTLIYNKYEGLSDNDSFKKAFLADLLHIAKINKVNSKELPSNLQYFIKNIDLNGNIDADLVEINDFCRSEVYANLFSYVQGYDDGDRKLFIKAFSNSAAVVKKDLETYL